MTNREVDFPALSGLIRAPYVDKPWPDFWTRRWATSRNAAPLEPKPYPALSAGDRCRKGSYPALSVFFVLFFFSVENSTTLPIKKFDFDLSWVGSAPQTPL